MTVQNKCTALAAALLLSLPHPAWTATTDTPRARAEIERYGSTYSGEKISALRAIYKVHLKEAGFATPQVERDLPYGTHERHRLDVHRPMMVRDGGAPVLVFIHGGRFIIGNKSDGEIFDNVLNYFAARGVLGINANYRLAPEYKWPSGPEDIRAIMRWIRDNAAEYGGDPGKVFLMGHSAGASHVAGYAFIEEQQLDGGRDGLRGAILLSGVYELANEESRVNYYGGDAEDVRPRMPMSNIEGRSVPLFIIDAEYDRLPMQLEAARLLAAICHRDGKCPMHKQVAGHNHFSLMYHINTRDDSVASDVMTFIDEKSGD